MFNGYFIAGTNTNIGKTFFSANFCKLFNFSYFKPLQTGDEDDCDYVKKFSQKIKTYNLYSLKQPLSPYIASKNEKIDIEIQKIISKFQNIIKAENLIVEGAGGVFVPILQDFFIIDLIKAMNIPVILVSNDILGTINHTLLTIKALRALNIKISCIIMNYFNEKSENSSFIEKYTNIPVFPLKYCDDRELEFNENSFKKIKNILL